MSKSTRQSVRFPDLLTKPVVTEFNAESTTSDGGAVLLKAVDERLHITETLACFVPDQREPGKVAHDVRDLVRQRVYGLACGYADTDEVARLGDDPMQKLLAERDPIEGARLASQATLSRFENSVRRSDLMRLGLSLMDTLLAGHHRRLRGRKPSRITIDLDPSDDPAHGLQEGSCFNGHYDVRCYLPLFAFVTFGDEPEQYAVGALLRRGTAPPTEGCFWLLRQLTSRLRRLFPKAKLRIRLDGGFAGPRLLEWLEAEKLEYVLGLARNEVLETHASRLTQQAWEAFDRHGRTVTLFGETSYAARSWRRRARRIVIKTEVVQHDGRLPRENVRFVVTNLPHRPQKVYEIYRQRGEIENRLKELFDGMAIGRTSCSRFLANQLRVLLTLAAYGLMQELRRRLTSLGCGRPQVHKLRLMLIKIGGWVKSSVRRIVLHLAQNHPWAQPWRRVARGLGGASP